MSESTVVERREVCFAGHVQGVGFRYTVRQIAARYQVTGFVRNLPDGCVQLVAEAARGELEGFLGDVNQTMSSYIMDTSVTRSEATGEFSTFEIRF